MFAGVIINKPTRVLDRTYLYDAGELEVSPGDLVSLEFGKGNRKESAFVLSVFEENTEVSDPRKIKKIISVEEKSLFTEDDIKVMDFIRRKYLSTWLEAIRLFIPKGDLSNLKHKKKMLVVPIKKPSETGKHSEAYNRIFSFAEGELKKGGAIKADFTKAGFSVSSVNTMIKNGYLEVREEDDFRFDDREFEKYTERNLNEDQKRVLQKIEEKNEGVFLLHGITGSGKTEVFLNAVSHSLKRGEDSIILVPEIALTPQLIERVKGRFGKDVAVYHSRLSEGEKFDEWMRIKKGKVKIAVGARSALFLPFKNLKTIIIDEEHEASYKSDMNPKYVTRETAEFMAGLKGGKVILSSATPSLESYKKALSGDYTLLELKKRAGEGALPKVSVVDLREELRKGNRTMISSALKDAVTEALGKKEQVILFINRRGMSGFVSCRSCGYVYKCRNCSVSLTKHRGGRLICHHCGHMEFQKDRCPSCGSSLVKEFGLGTEKLEETVKEMFPCAKVIRMDRDTTSNKEAYGIIYRNFKEGKADILIGTQMIAKGLDFDNVSLVGVIAADISMNLPDFRAYERTFQLLTQVSGRAGRKKEGGKVIIQTYEPDAYPVVTSAANDYEAFYAREIITRDVLSYPPFGELMSIVISSQNEGEVKEMAEKIFNEIKLITQEEDGITVLGPSQCLIGKLNGWYRYQIIIRGRIKEEKAAEIKGLLIEKLKNGKFRLSIDMNPQIIT